MPNFNLDNYEPVSDRVKKFWEKNPEGSITTQLVQSEPTVIVKATVHRNIKDQLPSASDYAEEVPGQGPVNRTSSLENCSTSAIGRALAALGFSATKDLASREEMEKVQRSQEPVPQEAMLPAGNIMAVSSPDTSATSHKMGPRAKAISTRVKSLNESQRAEWDKWFPEIIGDKNVSTWDTGKMQTMEVKLTGLEKTAQVPVGDDEIF